MPSSSIIIPVCNRAALTRQCLSALLDRPYGDGKPEIVVVDDASTDLTPRLLAGYGDAIKVIRHATNQGFAQACNAGAAAASGDYLVFLNNDTLPQPGWLDALVEYAGAHPAAAAVGSKLLFPNDTIQHAGVVICQDRFPRHIYLGFPADHPAVNKSRRFPIVTGACMLCPRARFLEANGFDTGFLNGFEDVDLCLRLGELGYEVHYCHTSVIYHFESATRARSGAHIDHVIDLYLSRWAPRVVPDDLAYYLEDGLLKVTYYEQFPVALEVSPFLGTVMPAGHELSLERLLNYRSAQVIRLLRELATHTSQRPLAELVASVTVPAPAAGPVMPVEPLPAPELAATSAWADEPDADLMHPDVEGIAGAGNPWQIGRMYLGYLTDLAGLRPHEHILEVGCGVGRMAIPLACYLDAAGGYAGFDIVASSVEWARNKITPRYPNFRFDHADIRNSVYNAAGQHQASEYRFPYGDCAFDVVLVASVFTHMLPADVERYVAEIARVLKPGGRCMASFFVLDEEHLRQMDAGRAFLTFGNDHGIYRTHTEATPEIAVAYDLGYVREMFARHGLTVIEPPHFGDWSGRQNADVISQDIILSRRDPRATAAPSQAPLALGQHSQLPAGAPPVLVAPAAPAARAGARLVVAGRRQSLVGEPGDTLVSVLMPVKNGADQLRALLAQVLRQRTSAQVEIIAVDSGSSDETIAILTEFGATVLAIDPDAFNHGLTRNLLAGYAHGDVLVFLNQTAVPANDRWLANLIEPLRRNPRLAGVCSRVIPRPDADPLVYREVVVEPSGSPERAIRAIQSWTEFYALDPHQRRLRLNFHTVSAAIRRSVLAHFPFRPVRVMAEDTQWAKDVLLAGYQLQHEPASMVYHSHAYSLAELLQRNVDDGAANRGIVDRRLGVDQVMPAAWAQAVDDSRYLQEELSLAGDELLEWQLRAFLRRTVQFAGQWVGSHDDRLDATLLPALSRVARMMRATAPAAAPAAVKHRLPFPPPDLLFRVLGARDVEVFERSGRMAVEDFAAALATQGASLADFNAIYDFGCGCGRLLRHLVEQVPAERLCGSDIDQSAIRWVQTHLPLVDARENEPLPPLTFANGAFDLVLGYSVFTHLDERYQNAWLHELQRVTATGAWLLLTVHGEAAWQASGPALGQAARALDEQRQEQGFVHWRGDGWEKHFPDFYHTSWHTPAYVRRHWSRWFTVVDVLENQARPSHDLVVLRRA